MGIFKKIFKGIGKVFKKIGRGIKKAFKAFGKFMGKIGFVGQLAMMFLFPAGIGALFTKGLGQLGAKLAAVSGNGMFAKAAAGIGQVMTKAANFVTKVRSGFSSITNGIKEFGKTALNKLPFVNIDGAAANFFGEGSAWSKTQAGFAETGKLSEALKSGKLEITDPTVNIKDLSNRVGITQTDLRRLNEGMFNKDGLINLGSEGMANVNLDLTTGFKTNFTPASTAESQATVQQAVSGVTSTPTTIDPRTATGKKSGMTTQYSADPQDMWSDPDELLINPEQTAYREAVKEAATIKSVKPVAEAAAGFKPPLSTGESDYIQKTWPKEALQNQKVTPKDSIATLENKAVDIEKASLERGLTKKEEEGWWKRFGEKTGAELDPSRAGLMRWGSNVQNLAGMFESPPDAPWGFRGSGLQDYHTGFGYQPPQPDMMQPPNNYGVQSLAEMLQYYGAYTPEQPWFLSPQYARSFG